MFQRVTLIGRVGSDPEMRFTSEGIPVCNFSLATTTTVSKASRQDCPAGWKESYNGKGWELNVWWRVTCWRGLAEAVNNYLTKGRQVFVEGEMAGEAANGSLNPRVWTGKDGVARASFELTAQTVKFLGSADSGSSAEPDTVPF